MNTSRPFIVAIGALLLSVTSLVFGWIDRSSNEEADADHYAEFSTVNQLQEHVDQLLLKYGQMRVLNDRGRRSAVEAAAGESAAGLTGALNVRATRIEQRVKRMHELLELRCRLLISEGGTFADELYSARYYVDQIRDPELSSDVRARAFSYITLLSDPESFMIGLVPYWIVDATEATKDENQRMLAFAATSLPKNEVIYSVIVDWVRYSSFDGVRRYGLAVLEKYDTEEGWEVIHAALEDPAEDVRREAKTIIWRRQVD